MNPKKFAFGLGLGGGAYGIIKTKQKIGEMFDKHSKKPSIKYAGADRIQLPEDDEYREKLISMNNIQHIKDTLSSNKSQIIAGGLTGTLAAGLAAKKYLQYKKNKMKNK